MVALVCGPVIVLDVGYKEVRLQMPMELLKIVHATSMHGCVSAEAKMHYLNVG